MSNPPPEFSVLVIAHNMRREIPRTLTSLAPPYQSGLTRGKYEVLVIENGSQEPLDESLVTARAPTSITSIWPNDRLRPPGRSTSELRTRPR